ncbi:transcriptional regulator [archaeon]|nr:transcriptional regulator [archaeon]
MLLPQEIEVFYVIPAIRRELAEALVSKGFKQKEVAHLLSVSEACVSNYFNHKRADEVSFKPEIKNLITSCADKISKGEMCFINAVQVITKKFKQDECLCRLHEKLDSHVCGCRGCLN